MEKISIIGLDLAKRSFQAHGALADGWLGSAKSFPEKKFSASLPTAALRRRHGSLWERTPLGAGHR